MEERRQKVEERRQKVEEKEDDWKEGEKGVNRVKESNEKNKTGRKE